jgi:hypothetical protein
LTTCLLGSIGSILLVAIASRSFDRLEVKQ